VGLLTRVRVRRRLVLVFVPALLAGCFSPTYQDGAFECGPAGDCPPGFTCAQDNLCYQHLPPFVADASGPADGTLPPDGHIPGDAAPDGSNAADAAFDATPGPADASVPDASVPDASVPDASVPDAPPPHPDAPPPPPDAAIPDAAVPDAAIPDAAVPDAAILDAAVPDAAILDAAVPDAAPDASPPSLADEGLFLDIASQTLDPGVLEYAPAYPLWSDGAEKQRWIKLPPGGTIDTSDMDHWRFPAGTKFFKQFRSATGTQLETRVITRFGADPGQVELRAYVWNAAGTDAFWTPAGAQNVNGTAHDVPDQSTCYFCHEGQPHYVLGFQAVQLSHPGPGVTLGALAQAGLLSDPPPPGEEYPVPGNPVQSAALGYLHANCGHCHNPEGYPTRTFNIDMDLFVTTAAALGPVELTPSWTTVNAPLVHFVEPPYLTRVVPRDPEASALFHRLSSRGTEAQMPPVATELVDADGQAAITAWIDSLP